MRTKTLLLTAALAAAGIAMSSAQTPVYSVNAVGYVNVSLAKGFNLISNPLKAPDNTVSGLFAGHVPDGTVVYVFSNATGAYTAAIWDELSNAFGPAAAAALPVPPGSGVFVKVPAATTITFVGEVPQGADSNVNVPKGFSVIASAVPQSGTATALGLTGNDGDILYQFNNATGVYTSFINDALSGGWTQGGQVKQPTVAVGEAVFYKAVNAFKWTRDFNVNS